MKVNPLSDRILVKREEPKETVKGGIVIPDTAKEKPQEARVVAVGPGRLDESGKRIPLEVKTEKVTETVNQLTEQAGWNPILQVPDDDENVCILMKATEDDHIAGLVIFVVDDDELVFANIVGNIDPEQFGRQVARIGLSSNGLDFSQFGNLFEGLEDAMGTLDSLEDVSASLASPDTVTPPEAPVTEVEVLPTPQESEAP